MEAQGFLVGTLPNRWHWLCSSETQPSGWEFFVRVPRKLCSDPRI